MYNLKHPYVGTEHLLLSILKNNNKIKEHLKKYNVTYETTLKSIKTIVGTGTIQTNYFLYTPVLRRIIENSVIDSKEENKDVDLEILFINFLEEGEGVGIRILLNLKVDIDKLYSDFKKQNKKKIKNNEIIKTLGINLNEQKSDPVIGREEEIQRIIEILSRRCKNNPILIGEAGVGKTAIIEELSKRIKEEKVPKKLIGKKIIQIDMASLVAGTKYRGEFEEKLKKLLNTVMDDNNIILFIDEIHTLVGAGGAEGAIDASNIFKPALARNKLSLIGATTIKEYKQFIENDKALERRFQKVLIEEPDTLKTIEILNKVVPIYEKYHNVKIHNKDIKKIVELTTKYIYDRHQPDASIDVLDEACSKVSLKESLKETNMKKIKKEYNRIIDKKNNLIKAEKYKEAIKLRELEKYYRDKLNILELNNKQTKKIVTIRDIANVIEKRTNIPLYEIMGSSKKTINEIEKNINTLYGQEKAKEKIIKTIKRIKLGLIEENKCLSYMFVGPSGVGKTMLATLTGSILVSKNNIIKLDMSEYKEPHSVSKIIGSPPGYIGYKDNNNILEMIKNKPNCVLILDEIESACDDVIKIFYQILENSKIRDSKGEYVYFNNVVIIMTSNIGTMNNNLGFIPNKNIINSKLKEYFSIPFINRINDIIIFDNLDIINIRKIIKKQLNSIIDKYDIVIKYNKIIIDEIIELCEYETYGARKINFIIKDYFNNYIIDEILNNKKEIYISTLKNYTLV